MGLREAVTLLEQAGFQVAFEGHGIVESQFPAPGDTLKEKKINLKLKEKYTDETK